MKKFPQSIFINGMVVIALCLLLQNCKVDNSANENEIKDDGVIEIVTTNMDFQSVDTIPSGWITFRYLNNSTEPHFFVLEKYPEGKTLEDGRKEVFNVFQKGMDGINSGNPEEGFAAFGELPEWFSKIIFSGGSGLVSPKNNSLTTINMEPGYYVIECYVKMENGTFHSVMGMSKYLVVTNETNENQKPEATNAISISSTTGITFDKPIAKGERIFSVTFVDQIVHENFVGHDINLIRLDDDVVLEEIESWMNWADPKGLIAPGPVGVTFMGGVNDMPAGSVAYFSATLEPGKYAFISEVPGTIAKNMLVTFSVSE